MGFLKKQLMASLIFMGGLFIMALGIVFMVQANIDVAPWDVFHLGLVHTVGLTIGTWSQIVGLTLIVVTTIATRKVPGVGAFLNMYFIGFFVDIILDFGWVPHAESFWHAAVLYLIGLILCGFGTGMYIAPGWGAGPRDGLMLAASIMLNRSIRSIRTTIEMIVLLAGWILGGPVNIGTLIYCLTIGPICQFFILMWRRILGQNEGRGARNEDFNKGKVRVDHHDGVGPALR